MSDAETFTRIALALAGTLAAPHFDRVAFKVRRTFATLAADGLSANLKFTADEQQFKTLLAPDLFVALDNGWGRQGWTRMDLVTASDADIESALTMAHAHAMAK